MDLAQLNLSSWLTSLVLSQGEVLRFLLASRGLETATHWAQQANVATQFEDELDSTEAWRNFFRGPAPDIGLVSEGLDALDETYSTLQLPPLLENELFAFPLLRLVLESDRPLTRTAQSIDHWNRSVHQAAEFGQMWIEALPDMTDSPRLASALSDQWPRWRHQLVKGKIQR